VAGVSAPGAGVLQGWCPAQRHPRRVPTPAPLLACREGAFVSPLRTLLFQCSSTRLGGAGNRGVRGLLLSQASLRSRQKMEDFRFAERFQHRRRLFWFDVRTQLAANGKIQARSQLNPLADLSYVTLLYMF